MKRVFSLAAFALLMFAPTAEAAGPWQSCYLGAHVGASIGQVASSDAFGNSTDGFGAAGVSGGATGGCDLQITGTPLVVGVWGDFTQHTAEYKETNGSTVDPLTLALDHQWAVGGKLGLALSDSVLPYFVGGYTQASFSGSRYGTALDVPDMSGYLLGGGLEVKVPGMHGLSIDVRYTYSHLSSSSVDGIQCEPVNLQPDVHTARVGATYRFNFDNVAQASLK